MRAQMATCAPSRGSGNANTNKEKEVRRWFVERDLIDGVIYLPENLFYNTTAPGIMLVLDKAKPKERRRKLFLLNATNEFTKGDPKNYLAADAITLTPRQLTDLDNLTPAEGHHHNETQAALLER